MSRQKFPTRQIMLRTVQQRGIVMALLPNLPLDEANPLEVIIREPVKARGPDQNSLMWAGPLADIAAQAWVDGRQFSAEVWHEHFKREYLPEEFDPELTKEGYRKWDYTPAGERVLIGSTTQLTKRGFSQYLEQIEADGAGMGVQFGARRMAA